MSNPPRFKVGYVFLSAGLVLSNLSCAVRPAEVQRLNVQADQLRNFDLPNSSDTIALGQNQFFLWPDSISAEQAKLVFDISNEIDLITTQKKKSEVRHLQLINDPEVVASNQKIQEQKQELSKKLGPLNKAKADLKNAVKKKYVQAQIELKEENSKIVLDSAKIEKMNSEIAKYSSQIADLGVVLPKLEINLQALQLFLDPVVIAQKELEQIVAHLALLNHNNQVELDQITTEIEDSDAKGQLLILQVTQLVEWYDVTNGVITFKTNPDGSLYASIGSWIIDHENRKFSTQPGPAGKPTIKNLKYNSHGGAFDFDVVVYENEATQDRVKYTFSFHILRNNYHAGPSKVCFQGDLIRTRILPDGTVESKKGIAKLVDNQ